MRVVISVGGSVLAPDLDPERVAAYAAALDRVVDAGHEVGVVVGGGPTAREYIGAARALDATEVELDRVGIAVTRLNARLLRAALAAPTAGAETYEPAVEALDRGAVPVMGGVAPGQTTDAVAAALAEDAGADLIVFATSVDGVYDADPSADPSATRHDRLTPAELVEVVAPMSRSAGASAPVDLLAAKLVERGGLCALVVDGRDPETVARAVVDDDHDGTEVRP
jgi:uridylate kinase